MRLLSAPTGLSGAGWPAGLSSALQALRRFSRRSAKGRPIWLYLVLFSVAIIVPSLLSSSYFLFRFADTQRQREHEQFVNEVGLFAGGLNQELSNNLTTLRVLAASLDLDEGDFASFHARASAALRDTDFFVILLDAEMQQILNTRVPYGSRLGRTADPRSAQAALRERRPTVSDVFVGSVARQPVINLTLPVIRGDTVPHVLILTTNVTSLALSIHQQNARSDTLITLVDSQNRIIARSERHNDFVNKPLAANLATASMGYSGSATIDETDGSRWLMAYQTLALADWRVIAVRPMAESERNLFASFSAMILGGLGLLVLTIAASLLIGRYMAVPMRDLTRQARSLGERNLIVPLNSHLREANEVSTVLSQAAEQRERHEDHIRLLMGELRHRSKNQFAVLQGIVKFTAKHSDDIDDFTRRFLPRLRSLSESLELFDIEGGQGVDIRSLVEAQMRSFDDARRGRMSAEGPSLQIASQAAQTLGLALHELGTNAAKYGALSTDHGRVDIRWGERPGEDRVSFPDALAGERRAKRRAAEPQRLRQHGDR
ncbi:MAG: hypothetical protein HC871_09805 [Rhizobiales bacterium]|nr:hypothetical protein [Hyphomicrobiales bacterium]